MRFDPPQSMLESAANMAEEEAATAISESKTSPELVDKVLEVIAKRDWHESMVVEVVKLVCVERMPENDKTAYTDVEVRRLIQEKRNGATRT